MITVNQMSKLLGISDTAVRQWTAEFADHLSPAASPEKGKQRRYSDDDHLLFTTIQVLRSQGVGFEDIHQALDDGVRHEPLESPNAEEEPAGPGQGEKKDPGSELEVFGAFKFTLEKYEDRMSTYEKELRDLRERLLTSENQRVAAQTRLDVMEEAQQAKPVGFWDRLFGR